MGSLRQAAKTLASAAGQAASRPSMGEPFLGQTQQTSPLWQTQKRHMAGGHHGHDITYQGLTLHKPASWHTNVANGFSGLMWFWILYRFYHDYDTFLFGHAQHFEHEIHEEQHGKDHDKTHH